MRIFSLLPHAPINCESAAFVTMVTCCIEFIAVIFKDFVLILTIKSRNCKCKMHTYFQLLILQCDLAMAVLLAVLNDTNGSASEV